MKKVSDFLRKVALWDSSAAAPFLSGEKQRGSPDLGSSRSLGHDLAGELRDRELLIAL